MHDYDAAYGPGSDGYGRRGSGPTETGNVALELAALKMRADKANAEADWLRIERDEARAEADRLRE